MNRNRIMNVKFGFFAAVVALLFGRCEKGQDFNPDEAVEIRISASIPTYISFGSYEGQLTDTDTVDVVLVKGTEIELLGLQGNGNVKINLNAISINQGEEKTYVVSDETTVPEDRVCEVWPERCDDKDEEEGTQE